MKSMRINNSFRNGWKVKRVTTVDLGIDKVKNKITDFEFLKSINDKIEELETVTEIDDNTKVVYQKMKGMICHVTKIFR